MKSTCWRSRPATSCGSPARSSPTSPCTATRSRPCREGNVVKETFGRLSKPPHPELHRLLYAPAFAHDAREVLPLLLRINAAHVVMLERCGIVERPTAAALLRANDAIAAAPPAAPESHRGLYAVFEQEL